MRAALKQAFSRILCWCGVHETELAWPSEADGHIESTCMRCGRKVRLP